MKVKRKILAAALACIMTVGFIPTNAFAAIDVSPSANADVSVHATLDGDGSETNPYKIEDADDLKEFAATVNDGELSACAELMSNIDLNPGITFNADGSYSGGTPNQWTVIKDYKGVFNGNSKTIRGLYIDNTESYQGLFGKNTGTIKNLGVIESYVSAGKDYTNGGYVGSIVGRNDAKGTVENCYNTGYVNGTNNVGGVAGYTSGPIRNCYNTGDITSSGNTVGGVAGHSATSLTDSYNTGTVTGGADTVGGVTGSAYGIVENCYNTGDVIGTGDFSWETNVGGVAGSCGSYSMAGTVQNCYNTGDVTGSNALTGGVTGSIDKRGVVVNCYNTGSVESKAFAGGIAGENSHGTLKSCHNTGAAQGSEGEGAIAGRLLGEYTVENTYYLSDTETKDGGRTEAQFASGEVAWLLNDTQSAQVWKQNIDNGEEKNSYPVLSGGDVYQVNQYPSCDQSGTPVKVYSNTNADILGAHGVVQHVNEKAATSTEDGNIEYWYCAGCGKHFADEALTEEISHEQTVIPAVNPSDYFFNFRFVDDEGNPIGGGTIYFDKTGPYSREEIELPDGYMQMIPAHPGEDWLYPTALEFVNGKWVVTNQDVEIMVEPMAKVEIIFKTPDGKVLEDLSYTKYYDSIGAGIETVTAPEGYEFVGENTYAVDVTRDESGKLVADPAEVVFWVKAEGTEIPVNPSDYSFTVKYVDGAGNPVSGGGVIYFDKTGPYSREDIPLPYGYMAIVPAHPGEEWLYPTALEFVNGKWVVTNQNVEIMVEPMAKVDIIFKTSDGKVLEDLSYTKYYDSIGAGIETVTAPEGYEFVGENTYAVDVTRDENGKLVADPAEVEFVVKAIGSGEPSKPEKPTEPSKPGEETDIPETGDSSNMWLWMMLVISGGALIISLNVRKNKKQV